MLHWSRLASVYLYLSQNVSESRATVTAKEPWPPGLHSLRPITCIP